MKQTATKQTASAAPLKRPEQVRAEFMRMGLSIAEWSRRHKVNPQLVYEILGGNPRRRCARGQSHRVAVLLGIKAGDLVADVRAINAVADKVSS